MSKEKPIVENEETTETPVRKKEDSLEAYKEETAEASDQPKKRHSNASVDPAKFNWDEFEKAADYGAPKEEVEKEYDNTFLDHRQPMFLAYLITELTHLPIGSLVAPVGMEGHIVHGIEDDVIMTMP